MPGWATAILLLIAINAGLIAWRADIVRLLPQTASLYAAIGLPVNLRGLVFTDIVTRKETQDGVQMLVVEGVIKSTSQARRSRCRGCALPCATRNGHEIYTWTALPARNTHRARRHHAVPLAARLAAARGACGAGALLQPARSGRRSRK